MNIINRVDIIDARRRLLSKLGLLKDGVEVLINNDFFKNLLEFYANLEKLEGFSDWKFLENESKREDCENCVQKKMLLIETLIFQLNESNVLRLIDDLKTEKELFVELNQEYKSQ